MTEPRVGAVVVTHGSDHVIAAALDSLSRHEPGVRTVVVDNASPGGPPAVPDAVALLALDENLGYGAACNRGAEVLRNDVDFIAFLNPDVRLQGPSLTELARGLGSRGAAGICAGPVVDEHGRRVPSAWGPASPGRAFVFAAGLRLEFLRRLLARFAPSGAGTSQASAVAEQPLPVTGHVLGGTMVVRRECFQELGGFDERFFLYWEDADLCVRAQARGWEVWVLPATVIVHIGGTSSIGSTSETRFRHYVDGARIFGETHHDRRRARRLVQALRAGARLRALLGG